MTFSLYRASVPVFSRGLAILSDLLVKAEAFSEALDRPSPPIIDARLAPDMFPLAGQVQRACDTAKFAVARLTGGAGPSFPDDETTFARLQERIDRTTAYLAGIDPELFVGGEARSVTFNSLQGRTTLDGSSYLLEFALPNFFFHVTTAYDILRHNGVQLGKRDFLGHLGQ